MKFSLAFLVYALIGLVLGLGIYLAVKGSYWLLICSTMAYMMAFARLGCAEH